MALSQLSLRKKIAFAFTVGTLFGLVVSEWLLPFLMRFIS